MKDFDLYSFGNYRNYLRKAFSGIGEHRGRRILLAEELGCQTSFLSQVLTDRAHLSLEHAIKTSRFLNHSDDESRFFILLIEKEKAGSVLLEKHFEKQLLEIKLRRQEIKDRIQVVSDITPEDQMHYYSAWYYAAIHIFVALPGLNTLNEITKRLRLSAKVVKEALEFLETRGFILKEKGEFRIGSKRIHLSRGSPMLSKHHTNWRMQAINSVDGEAESDLHYSAILGISKTDQEKFKEKLLALLAEFEPIVKSSKEEIPVVMLMDLFEI
jgi:uncharacterized protein (TIGR02147 family)